MFAMARLIHDILKVQMKNVSNGWSWRGIIYLGVMVFAVPFLVTIL